MGKIEAQTVNQTAANPSSMSSYAVPVAHPVNSGNIPYSYPAPASAPLPSFVNQAGAREYLSRNHWPPGLQETLIENVAKIPIRFFICDDSGSMNANDGNRLVLNHGKYSFFPCSRWTELTESLKFHAELSKEACAISEFRMLNSSEPIRIGLNDGEDQAKLDMLKALFSSSPDGGTPLCRHISEVIQQIRGMEQELRSNGQKACIIIATDGESSDGNVAEALRPLRDLPAWVVIRLCTDEEHIVNYWNNIDNELELNMDVLDDLCGEAKEIYQVNPWLTYGQPLHRLREFGVTIKELDILDEAKFSADQIRCLCKVIFGGDLNNYPHPVVDFSSFQKFVKTQLVENKPTWDPVHKTVKGWIDVNKVGKALNKNGCIIM